MYTFIVVIEIFYLEKVIREYQKITLMTSIKRQPRVHAQGGTREDWSEPRPHQLSKFIKILV